MPWLRVASCNSSMLIPGCSSTPAQDCIAGREWLVGSPPPRGSCGERCSETNPERAPDRNPLRPLRPEVDERRNTAARRADVAELDDARRPRQELARGGAKCRHHLTAAQQRDDQRAAC